MTMRHFFWRGLAAAVLIALLVTLSCFSDPAEVAQLDREVRAEQSVAQANSVDDDTAPFDAAIEQFDTNPFVVEDVPADLELDCEGKEALLAERLGDLYDNYGEQKTIVVPLGPDATAQSNLYYDTWIFSNYDTANYGDNDNMYVGYHTDLLIFSGWANGLFKYIDNNCPDGTVTEALLWVYITDNYLNSNETYYVRRVGGAWNETFVTWENAPGATGTQEATTCTDDTTGLDWYVATAAVQEVCNDGLTDNGIYFFTNNSSNDDIRLRTYEYAGLPAAYLEITYTPIVSSSSTSTYQSTTLYSTTIRSTTLRSTTYLSTTYESSTHRSSTYNSTTNRSSTYSSSTSAISTTLRTTTTLPQSSTTYLSTTVGSTTTSTVPETTSTAPGSTTSQTSTSVCPAPTAQFVGNPTSGPAPLTVNFTDQSNGNGCPITGYNWVFGDGNNSTEQNPVNVFENPGTYFVALAVHSDGGADTETKPEYITVTEPGDDDVIDDDQTDDDAIDDDQTDDDAGNDDVDDDEDDDNGGPLNPGDSDTGDSVDAVKEEESKSNCGCSVEGDQTNAGVSAALILLLGLGVFVLVERGREHGA